LGLELSFVSGKGWLGYGLYFSFTESLGGEMIIYKINVDNIVVFGYICRESRYFVRWLKPIFGR
jgi:hypothetical protein